MSDGVEWHDDDDEPVPAKGNWWVDATFDDMTSRQAFLDKVAAGTTPFNAGIEVGWTPAATKKNVADPEFAELISYAQQMADGNIEKKLHDIALKGNLGAIQMWLFNRRPEMWKDVKRIEVNQNVNVQLGVVHSVKEAAHELMRGHSIADLQRLAIEATSSDDDG